MQEKSIKDLNENVYELIGNDWGLLTAGDDKSGFNTMTISWGQMGALWATGGGLPVATTYVRPQRYTKEFVDKEAYYTLSFFTPEYKKQLGYLGSHSGRDEDKVAKSGLTPVFEEGYTYFAEARLVLICKKLYQAPIIEEGFVDKSIVEEQYADNDYHTMYIGHIVKILKK